MWILVHYCGFRDYCTNGDMCLLEATACGYMATGNAPFRLSNKFKYWCTAYGCLSVIGSRVVTCAMLSAHADGTILLELRALMAYLASCASASLQAMVWNRSRY